MDVPIVCSLPADAARRVRRTRRWSVRPYVLRPRPALPASPVPLPLLMRVRDGLRALDSAAPPPSAVARAEAVRALAVELGPLARRLRVLRPEAWAPVEVNAPHPDRTATVPIPVVVA